MQITLIAHDIRSTHNVGAFFRTCDGLGVEKIIFSGYTPYPTLEDDTRLPHFADKLTRQIHKTALGAETTVDFERYETLNEALKSQSNSILIALEQSKTSQTPEQITKDIRVSHQGKNIALIVGNEIHGVSQETLDKVDYVMEIPMHGKKESFNVSVATAIALYELSKIGYAT